MVLPISSTVPAHTVNNAGSYASEWKPSDRKLLDRYFTKLIELRRRSVQSRGTPALLRASKCLVNRKYVELHSTRQKARIPRGSVFPRLPCRECTHARELALDTVDRDGSPSTWSENVHAKSWDHCSRRSTITLEVSGHLHSTLHSKWLNPCAVSGLILFA